MPEPSIFVMWLIWPLVSLTLATPLVRTFRAGFLARPFAHVATETSSSQFVHSILVSVSMSVFPLSC